MTPPTANTASATFLSECFHRESANKKSTSRLGCVTEAPPGGRRKAWAATAFNFDETISSFCYCGRSCAPHRNRRDDTLPNKATSRSYHHEGKIDIAWR